jgi:hypothetical protein
MPNPTVKQLELHGTVYDLQVDSVNNCNPTATNTNKYDWIGTQAEYIAQDVQTNHPDWVCFITDDISDENGILNLSDYVKKTNNVNETITGQKTFSSPSFAQTPSIDTTGTQIATAEFVRQIIPAGLMFPYAGATAPSGFLLCDGSAVSRTTYASLFAVVGTYYGAGDGSTTFNLPNHSSVVVGKSNIAVSVNRTQDVGVGSTITSNGALALTDGTSTAHLRWYASGNADGARLWDTGLYANGSQINTSYQSGLKVSNSITQPTFSGSLSNTATIRSFIIKY